MKEEYKFNFELSNIWTRKEIRDKLVNRFLEFPKEIFQPIYLWVENKNGYSVYLTCPWQRNKGIDFVINAEWYKFKSKKGKNIKNPSHDNIIQDLVQKKQEDENKFKQFYIEIQQVFECKIEAETNIQFNSGIPADLLLKLLKWLFIEQDITYWTKSGRKMLMKWIDEKLLLF